MCPALRRRNSLSTLEFTNPWTATTQLEQNWHQRLRRHLIRRYEQGGFDPLSEISPQSSWQPGSVQLWVIHNTQRSTAHHPATIHSPRLFSSDTCFLRPKALIQPGSSSPCNLFIFLPTRSACFHFSSFLPPSLPSSPTHLNTAQNHHQLVCARKAFANHR